MPDWPWGSGTAGFYMSGAGCTYAGADGNPSFVISAYHSLILYTDMALGWASGAITGGVLGASLYRDGANDIIAQRRTTNAQTFRTYGTYTDASNYRRVALAMTTGGVATLKAEGAGTGSSGNVLHISSLPTSNPGPGILWDNAGTPAIGT
jgi:hypothetical protein